MKIGHLYNLESVQSFIDSGKRSGFQDSDSGIVLARNLTAVDPKIFEKKYPELSFINSGIQIDNTGGYARRIQSLRILEQGEFADAGDESDDKGKISLSAEDSFLKVFVKEAHSKWTDDDIKESAMQNINLPQRYLQTHTKIYNRLVDSIGYLGHNSQVGLLNAGFSSAAATAAIGTITALELYSDISGLINAQWNGVNNVPEYKANRVVMPIDAYNAATTLILNTAAGSSTVMKALRDNYPGVEFMSSVKASDSSLAATVTCAYTNHEDAMKMRIPVPLTIGEIIKIGSFDFQVDSKARIAGLDILESTAGYYLTGL